MSLSSFQESLDEFIEPWKTLVRIVSERFHKERFLNNFVVSGEYPHDEQVVINAWSIVGIVPGCPAFLECHLTSGGEEHERSHWVSRLREACSALSLDPELTDQSAILTCLAVRKTLGEGAHVVGMLSLHQTIGSKKDFAVLWTHPQLKRSAVEHIVKKVLDVRLKP